MIHTDKAGNKKQALTKPVGGRPVTLYSKKDIETIEKKGFDPFARVKAFAEYVVKKPTRGY